MNGGAVLHVGCRDNNAVFYGSGNRTDASPDGSSWCIGATSPFCSGDSVVVLHCGRVHCIFSWLSFVCNLCAWHDCAGHQESGLKVACQLGSGGACGGSLDFGGDGLNICGVHGYCSLHCFV